MEDLLIKKKQKTIIKILFTGLVSKEDLIISLKVVS